MAREIAVQFDAGLKDEERAVIAQAQQFGQSQVVPQAARWEYEHRYPDEVLRAACSAGLARIEVPVSRGGMGLSYSTKLRVVEELAAYDFSFAFSLVNHHNATLRVANCEGPLAEQWLSGMLAGQRIGCAAYTEPEHGSDLSRLQTSARRVKGGWLLTGRKAWITNAAVAGVFLTLAQTEPSAGGRGLATFLVEAGREGFQRAPAYELQEGHAIAAGGFELHDYFAPDEALLDPPGLALKRSLAGINGARAYVAAMCAGMLEASLGIAVEYTSQRQAFGQPLIEFQGLRWSLVDAETDLAALRMLVYHAARQIDAHQDATQAAARAKKFAGERTLKHLAGCLQALGANGLRTEYPLVRHLAAAKIACFTDGTTEMMNERLGKLLVKGRPSREAGFTGGLRR
jgi:alkylation response protein AidB-like acyl-CoA dehydrogenase